MDKLYVLVTSDTRLGGLIGDSKSWSKKEASLPKYCIDWSSSNAIALTGHFFIGETPVKAIGRLYKQGCLNKDAKFIYEFSVFVFGFGSWRITLPGTMMQNLTYLSTHRAYIIIPDNGIHSTSCANGWGWGKAGSALDDCESSVFEPRCRVGWFVVFILLVDGYFVPARL